MRKYLSVFFTIRFIIANLSIVCVCVKISYLGALVYRYAAIIIYTILGNHTAKRGAISPFVAKVEDMVEKRI